MKKALVRATLLAALAGTVAAQEEPTRDQGLTWADLLGSNSTFRLYGFLRLDAMYDDSRMNDPQIPFLVRSEDPSPPMGVPPGTVAEPDDDEFAFSTRLTRLGMELESSEAITGLGDPSLAGKIEVDFYNIGLNDSDSRTAIRMRLAYLTLNWTGWTLLAGQAWDVISPLYPVVNNDLVMWGAGNTGDRRPQLTLKNETAVGPGTVRTQVGAALTGAVGGTTVQSGLRSGENSGRPMFHGRVGYHGELASGGKYQLGVWAHDSEEEFDATGAGSDQVYDSYSVGLDARIPLYQDRVWLTGEYFQGENLRDVRGGILQGVNGTTGMEIESSGGWVELGCEASSHLTVYAGYSYDDPEDADLSSFMASKNTVPYVAARWRYDSLRFGVEVLDWTTDYVGLQDGDELRVVGWIAYYF